MNFKKDMIKYFRKAAIVMKQESKGKPMKMPSPTTAAGLPYSTHLQFCDCEWN